MELRAGVCRGARYSGVSRDAALPMTERDLDIDFDFFDEGETAETVEAQRLPRKGQGPPAPPPARPPTSLTPLLRLIGLIAFAIFIVVVLVFWIQSCQADGKHARYSSYMTKVGVVGSQSARLGRNLNTQLTTPGIKLADLVNNVRGLARQQQQLVTQGQDITPPGPLRTEHQHMIESLQFRSSGLSGLADAFEREGSTAKTVPGAGKRIAAQTERFIASDVVWDDLFKTPSQQELENQNISGVQVPDSTFVTNTDLTNPSTIASILQRMRGVSTGRTSGGLHGTGLESVKVLPAGKELSTTTETNVNTSDDLAFAVTVKDTGDSVETHIPVNLTIQQSSPIKMTKVIDLIEPGKSVTVTFRDNFGARVSYGELVKVLVAVTPVPEEKNTSNNSAEFPVIFSLPQ
jgi:hypothetical protein